MHAAKGKKKNGFLKELLVRVLLSISSRIRIVTRKVLMLTPAENYVIILNRYM
jgi:hypothetical protein